MSVQVQWSGPAGGEAEVTALDGERITLRSTTPHAPGSRPEGALAGHVSSHPPRPPIPPGPAGAGALRVKVARCRREGERFVVEGRLIDATRGLRAEIEERLQAGKA